MRDVAVVAGPRAERNISRIIPMKILSQPPKPMVAWRRHALVFASLGLLAACANSDFGEVNPVLVTDGIHDWIGRDRSVKPVPPSKFEYTDDERALRDNAYPLIEPPYDRQQWYSVTGEYGLIRFNLARTTAGTTIARCRIGIARHRVARRN